MTLNLLFGRWWLIVCPPSGALCDGHKGCISRAVRCLMTELTYIWLFARLPVAHLIQVTRGLNDMETIAEVLTY